MSQQEVASFGAGESLGIAGKNNEAAHRAQSWVALAAVCGAVTVALGAFGSHGLRDRVSPELLAVWRTAVEYQMFHTLAILAIALSQSSSAFRWTLRLWVGGIVLFSGSLYALVLSDMRMLGMITPLGGSLLIAGWLVLAWTAWTR